MTDLGVDLDDLVQGHRRNATLAWIITAAMVVIALWQLAAGDRVDAIAALGLTALVAAPGPFHRSLWVTLPWEIAAVAAVAVGASAAIPGHPTFYATVAVASVVAGLDLHLFTDARLRHRLAANLVPVATAAVAGAWVALRWAVAEIGYGTLPNQSAIMAELLTAAVAGPIAGLVFEGYVVGWEARLDRFTPLLEGKP